MGERLRTAAGAAQGGTPRAHPAHPAGARGSRQAGHRGVNGVATGAGHGPRADVRPALRRARVPASPRPMSGSGWCPAPAAPISCPASSAPRRRWSCSGPASSSMPPRPSGSASSTRCARRRGPDAVRSRSLAADRGGAAALAAPHQARRLSGHAQRPAHQSRSHLLALRGRVVLGRSQGSGGGVSGEAETQLYGEVRGRDVRGMHPSVLLSKDCECQITTLPNYLDMILSG